MLVPVLSLSGSWLDEASYVRLAWVAALIVNVTLVPVIVPVAKLTVPAAPVVPVTVPDRAPLHVAVTLAFETVP